MLLNMPLNFIHACRVALASTLLFASVAWAQTSGALPPIQDVAQLSASGSVEVQQDLLMITLNTSHSGADAAAVQAQLKQVLDSALAVARSFAVPGQLDVRTRNFSLYPRYDKAGKINGWQGSAELVLEGRDFPRITSTAAKIDGMTIGNVGFALSREQRTRVEAEAQALAIAQFKLKAAEVARSFGFGGYGLREVSVSTNDSGFHQSHGLMSPAASMARGETASTPVPVEAGKSTVVVVVSGSVQMR
jgi:predicted secreted protein